MQADVYSTQKPDTYILVAEGTLTASVPENVLAPLGNLKKLKSIKLDVPNLIGLNPAEAKAGIEQKGYYVAGASVKVAESLE